MTTITFDTYKIAKRLESKGFTAEQAGGVVEALSEIDVTHAATKNDLRELELKIENKLKDMQIRIGTMIIALGGILIAVKYFG